MLTRGYLDVTLEVLMDNLVRAIRGQAKIFHRCCTITRISLELEV